MGAGQEGYDIIGRLFAEEFWKITQEMDN